jgi:hypothetical protein
MMAGMYVNSSRLFGFAIEARDRTRKAIEAQPGASPGDAAVTVIMAVVAAEGFINELAEAAQLFDGEPGVPSGGSNRLGLTSLGRLLRGIEDERGSIQLKYQVASLALTGSTFDPGMNPFQDFDTLVNLRNLLVHFRPWDTVKDGGGITGNRHPKLVRSLQQRGLARTPAPNTIETWSATVMTAGVADWACAAALDMIVAVVERIPSGPTRVSFSGFEQMQRQQGGT